MAPLPEIPNNVAQLRAPTSRLSPEQIAAPYQQLANALGQEAAASTAEARASISTGESLKSIGQTIEQDVAKPAAKQAGFRAVTRDAEGNVQVERIPIFGAASTEFEHAVKFAAVADGEGEIKRGDIALREQFRDDPKNYLKAADEYKKKIVKQYTDAAGPEVGLTLGRIIEETTTQTWRGLQNEHERLVLQRSDKSMEAGTATARDDLVAMARGGITSGAAWDSAFGKYKALVEQRVSNPRLAYPREQADYDLQHLDGELKANGFLYHVDQVYKDQGVAADGSSTGGAGAALESAKSILTDQSIKLTPEQRNAFYHKAVAEVRANEAIRRQDVQEARAAASELRQASAFGMRIDTASIDNVINAFKAAGDPAGAARFGAAISRMPLNDDFGRQPLSAQTEQLTALRGAGAAQEAMTFFTGRGYTREEAAGIVGNLFTESRMNTAAVHDGGIGLGLAGWNKERLVDLRNFARDKGKPVTDFQTQLEFVDYELRGSEAAAGAALKGAKTPEAAAAAMLHYERPQGYDPNNVTVSSNFTNRVSAARALYGGGIDPGEGGVAGSAWLTANRQRAVQTNARAAWTTIAKDYDSQGIRPADAVINQVITAARATNDADLLETIANGVEKMDVAKRLSQSDLPAQSASMTQLRQAGNEGLLTPGQAGVLKDLERRNSAITTGLEDNPISTAVVNFSDRFKAPVPLDMTNDQAFLGGLQYRAKIAEFAQQNWRTGPLAALDKADVAQVSAALDTPDMAVKSRIFGAINTLPEGVRAATLERLGAKGPEAMTQVMAGALMRQAPDVAQSILRGQDAMKADPRNDPRKEGEKAKDFNLDVDKVLPGAAFTLEGRTSPTGAYATVRNAVVARYADLMAQDPNSKKEFNQARLQRAANDVTGGILYHNGQPLIAPARGMSQSQFDGVVRGVTDNDLAGVTTLAGSPVNERYLLSTAQLESVGEGRYFVRLGRDPEKPIYAYRGANTEAPEKFVLDLRGRKPVDYRGAPPVDLNTMISLP